MNSRLRFFLNVFFKEKKIFFFRIPLFLFLKNTEAQNRLPTNFFNRGFIENKGQINNSDVLLAYANRGLQVFITNKGVTYLLYQNKKDNTQQDSC